MNKREIGGKGERAAKRYLQRRLYKILECNFHSRTGEIDIIARRLGTIVFVEVKLRSSGRFGSGAEAVNAQKQARIISCARYYLHIKNLENKKTRFDVIEINGRRINHIKNAFGA